MFDFEYFSEAIPFEEQSEILDKYSEFREAFEKIEFYHCTRKRPPVISRMALKITNRIKKEFKIDLFPAIFRYFTNFCAYGEAWRFYMLDKEGIVYNFADRAKDYLVKKNHIVLDLDEEEPVFYIQNTGKGKDA